MSDYKFIGEDDDTFQVEHPDGSQFYIAKNAVGPGVHEQIKSLKSGGKDDDFIVEPVSDIESAPNPSDYSQMGPNPQPMLSESQGPMGPPEPQYPMLNAQSAQQPLSIEPVPQSIENNPVPQQQTPSGAISSLAQSQQKVFTDQEQATRNIGKIQQDAFTQSANTQDKLAKDIANLDAQTKKIIAPINAELDNLAQGIKDYKIDPNRLWNNSSTGNKVLAAISIGLSGIGAGLQGPNAKNMAMETIYRSIDQDIEAQKMELGKKQTLFSDNLKRLGNAQSAEAMAKMQLITAAQAQISASGARANSAEAAQRMQLALSALQLEKDKLAQKVGIFQMAQKGGDVKPSLFVQHLVPKEHQESVFKEIERASNTRTMGDTILKDFEQAAKENTVLRTGAGIFRTPGSVLSLHQAMQPTFQDLEGTVRQAAMDNTFKNITPGPGDTEHKIQQKREALQEYLKSKGSAPRAYGYGIDLDKFGSTTTQSPQMQEIKSMNGVQYKKVPGGWQRI